MPEAIAFENSYTTLPDRFYSRQEPRPVSAPALIRVNAPLAEYLGVDPGALTAEVVAGNRVPEGAEPIATIYAGHQFGQFNPQLGDGRAVLLGEVVARDGVRHDLQLKGSGMTPYSRGGDGRSPLGPVVREYVVSEAMAALGIPTTRALAAATTGEPVYREEALPGGVLLRVARSHIRIGTFELFASREDGDALRVLVDHVIARHYPDQADAPNLALALLRQVAARQAELVAGWQLLGFIHGVMNTDNMLICGDTIDYGPCAFVDAFDPAKVFSSIDQLGRYAYNRQPGIAQWNIACLARALIGIIGPEDGSALEEAQGIIDGFPALHADAFERGAARKLGLAHPGAEDGKLAVDLLQLMHDAGADFTLTFRHLTDLVNPDLAPERSVAGIYEAPQALEPWLERWRARLSHDGRSDAERAQDMRLANPAIIPRNHLVEEAIRDAEDNADFGRFHALVDALAEPHEYDSSKQAFVRPPRPEQRVARTFCGT